jgi:hypothetical protein
MPNKFPFLKTITEPYGLIEQLSFAVTQDPDEDRSFTAENSWFGRLLLNDPAFRWEYFDDSGVSLVQLTTSKDLAEAYHSGRLRYTSYDWEIETMTITNRTTGRVTGAVNIKGDFTQAVGGALISHRATHSFELEIVKGNDEKWRLKQWILRRKPLPSGTPPTAPFSEVV